MIARLTTALRGRWLALLCLLPFAIVFIVFQVAPLAWVAVHSLINADTWSLANYSKIFASRFYLQAIQHSLQIAFWSSVIGMFVAILGSYSLRQVDSKLRDFVMAFSNMTSNFAGVPLAFAFIILLGFNGTLTLLLKQSGVISDFNLYSKTGLIVLYSYFQIPLGVLLLYPAFDALRLRVGIRLGDTLRVDIDPGRRDPRALDRRDRDATVARSQIVEHVAVPDLRQVEHRLHHFGRGRHIDHVGRAALLHGGRAGRCFDRAARHQHGGGGDDQLHGLRSSSGFRNRSRTAPAPNTATPASELHR